MATKRKSGSAPAPRVYTAPALSPLYMPPPYEYRDLWAMMIPFKSDPKVIAKLVPAPLVPDPQGACTVTISRFFTAGFGSYHEFVLAAGAKFQGRAVNYSLYLVLDNDIAIAAGREIWGFPKKFGRVTLGDRDGVMKSEVERGGFTIARAGMQIGPLAQPGDMAGSPEYVNLKVIPSVNNAAPPDVMQLTSTTLTNIAVRLAFKGRAMLELGASPADPFNAIPVREVGEGFYYNADFTLGDGVVIHDYRE